MPKQISSSSFCRDIEETEKIRKYYTEIKLVRCAIDFHSKFPLASVDLACPSYPEAHAKFLDVAHRMGLGTLIYDISRELMLMGEVFIVHEKSWDNIRIIDPDNIEARVVKQGEKTIVAHFIIPDESIYETIRNGSKEDKERMRAAVDPYAYKQILDGKPILLSGNPDLVVVALSRGVGSVRGVSLISGILPVLDQLNALNEQTIKTKIGNGNSRLESANDIAARIEKVRALETEVFEYFFPVDPFSVESWYVALQEQIVFWLNEKIFKNISLARKFKQENGDPVVCEINIPDVKNLANNSLYRDSVEKIRNMFRIDRKTMSVDSYLKMIRGQ